MARVDKQAVLDKMSPRYKEFERILREVEDGERTEKSLQPYYQSLRTIVNRRIKEMTDAGLISTALDRTYAYNRMENETPYFGAFTKQDDAVQTFSKMLDFYESLFSTKRGYQIAIEEIKQDFESAGFDFTDIDQDEFAKFVASGDFAELTRLIGNSPEVEKDIESVVNEGVTAEELRDAFSGFIDGSYGYDEALERAREAAQAHLNAKRTGREPEHLRTL